MKDLIVTDETTDLREVIDAFANGEMIVVKDDDGRENEGDLIVAAVHCTAEKMAFIVRHSSGIVCTPITAARAAALNLEQMVAQNDAPHATAFTTSIDFRHSTTTGISASDRTLTVRNLANPNAGAGDFVKPGHIFPLVSREGGTLIRSGHTEAATDLCRLAGLPEVGVICELVNDDGSVKRGPELDSFAAEHGLRVMTVADLIAYRQRTERLVEHVQTETVRTLGGEAEASVFEVKWDATHHLAVVFGLPEDRPVPVRFQVENALKDVFGDDGVSRGVIERMGREKSGIIVYLREGSVGVRQEEEDHREVRQRSQDWREIGLGAQILRSLGVSRISLLASKPRRYVGLDGFGIEIAEIQLIDDFANGKPALA